MLDLLKRLNPHITMNHIDSEAFRPYGRLLEGYDFSELEAYMRTVTLIPEEGNIYVPSVKEMEDASIYKKVEKDFYGCMTAQIGYCNGMNSNLNGLEYHKSSEIDIAVTDLVLLLGRIQDIEDNSYDAGKVEAFFVPKGTAVELYATTLHFSPCKTSTEGFKCIVMLPMGTNMPLEYKASGEGEEKLLLMKNKWLLAHPERKVLIERGAHPGIIGDNIEVHFKE